MVVGNSVDQNVENGHSTLKVKKVGTDESQLFRAEIVSSEIHC